MIAGPDGTESVKEWLAVKDAVSVKVSGSVFSYSPGSRGADLPPLGFPRATLKPLLVNHRKEDAGDSLILSIAGDQVANTSGGAGANGIPLLEVSSDSENSPWGGDVMVLATFATSPMTYRLPCEAAGLRLLCSVPAGKDNFNASFTLSVVDPDHAGGTAAIKALHTDNFGDCGLTVMSVKCAPPIVQSVGQPKWESDGKNGLQLAINLELINMEPSESVVLYGAPSNDTRLATAQCPDKLSDGVCHLKLAVPPDQFANVTDSMRVSFEAKAHEIQTTIQYARSNAQPLATTIDSDTQTSISGQNLFFDNLRVGGSGSPIAINCDPLGGSCIIPASPRLSEGRRGLPILPVSQGQG